jgi:hypothetical protein
MFAALLAEIRAYGEGLVIAEQIPAKLAPDVVKNTAVKIVHRLPAADDRDTVGATMNLTDTQSQYVVTLRPGTAAVSVDGMDFPVLVRMPDGTPRETTVPVVAPVTQIIARPHGSCGPDCAARPCTLTDIEDARQLLANEPCLVLWAELAVVAHLIHRAVPVPTASFTAWLFGLDPRLRDAAVALAVQDAVAVRSAPLAATHSPAEFADHVAGDLRGSSAGRRSCESGPWTWLAPPYRWSPVIRALISRLRSEPTAARHPETRRWERVLGRDIPGGTCQEQLENVGPWSVQAARDPVLVEALLFGIAPRSSLEAAIGALRWEPGWAARVAESVRCFDLGTPWPSAYLDPARGGWLRPDAERRG